MITLRQLKNRELDQLYAWVDGIALTRPKKNISRDFSDATMMAEIIHKNFPKLVELHNYPAANATKNKLANWRTLANKVLKTLGIRLTEQDCKRLSESAPLAIQSVLYDYYKLLQQNNVGRNEKMEEEVKQEREEFKKDVMSVGQKAITRSKLEEMRETLSLLKQKCVIVQKSIDRKDIHIQQLNEMLKQYVT